MAVRELNIDDLVINKANDRHGELESEAMAIAWLFSHREAHMRNLARDIAAKGGLYELPLVNPDEAKFIVLDGNRRVTSIKLLKDPRRAPTTELQAFFAEQRASFQGIFPSKIECQVETDRERIDEILLRRHTGTQGGIGQLTWDDRMKATFVARTGQGGSLSVADEIEKRLSDAGKLPEKKIPRSTMNRLLSAEPFRNRLGFSINKGRFEYTRDEAVALDAMARVAGDLADRKLVLGDIWNVDGKREYLDGLEREGVLPGAQHATAKAADRSTTVHTKAKPSKPAKPTSRPNLIPRVDYGLTWPGRLQRHRQIWEELQFQLELSRHPNAILVLLRVLLELALENYVHQRHVAVHDNDKLAVRLEKVGKDLLSQGKIDQKQMGVLTKFKQSDQLVSADTLNRYIHSPNFAPSPEHLTSLWDSLSEVIVHCLQA